MSSFLAGATVSPGGTAYFTDQNGAPYMVRGDSIWGMVTNAGQNGGATTYQTDMSDYISTRQSQGFNLFLTAAVGAAHSGAPASSGATWDGVLPFTGGDPSSLNNTYWTRVDYLLTQAQAAGMTVVLSICFTYAFSESGGAFSSATGAQMTGYGTAIGTRYKSYPNIVWHFGDDYNDGPPGGAYNALFSDALAGLRSAGDTHLVTSEEYFETTSRASVYDGTQMVWGSANAQFDWCYSYNTSYSAIESAYGETGPAIPVLKADGWYEFEDSTTEAEPLFMRKWAWWALSCGSRGLIYGRGGAIGDAGVVWAFPADTLSILATNTFDNTTLNAIWTTFASFRDWHLLVPDTSSALVTSGRGTPAAPLAPAGEYQGGNNYVTAAVTASGSLALVYIPVAATITINPALLAAGYTASWVDPLSGAKAATTAGTSFNSTPLGNNSGGNADWLLALQGPVPATAPIGLYTVLRRT